MKSQAYVLWPQVNKEVMQAARTCYPDRRYGKSKIVAEHILANIAKYPQFKDLSRKKALFRTTKAMQKMNWPVRTQSGKSGSVFELPWGK